MLKTPAVERCLTTRLVASFSLKFSFSPNVFLMAGAMFSTRRGILKKKNYRDCAPMTFLFLSRLSQQLLDDIMSIEKLSAFSSLDFESHSSYWKPNGFHNQSKRRKNEWFMGPSSFNNIIRNFFLSFHFCVVLSNEFIGRAWLRHLCLAHI